MSYRFILRGAAVTLFFGSWIIPHRATNQTVVSKPTAAFTPSRKIPATEDSDTVTLVAVGDLMLGTNFPSPAYLPPDGYESLLRPALSYLRGADVAFGNLEGTILDTGGTQKKCQNPAACYLFRMNTSVTDVLKSAGFDLLNVANNHSGDFGQEGRDNVVQLMSYAEIGTAGFITKPGCIITRKGVKIGMAGFAPNTGTTDINNDERITQLMDSLRPLCDILIASFHGGAEGRSRQHITRKHEIFYEEDRGDVYHFARVAIDAGADVVLGHGPHVPRAVDSYKGKFIIYSLGNFCTYSRFNLSGENGYAPLLRLYLDKKGSFLKAEIISFQQLGEGGPTPDPENKAYLKIKELTLQDIPEASLKFVSPNIIAPK
jgi:poly-gamma-glutamate capsule biosynthesis protein CapA/YwtB (metallophosphatase superfamily)